MLSSVFHSYMNEKGADALAPALAQLAALAADSTITRAAEPTGTSQPTLSRSIKTWEQDLGIELVIRRGRRVELSEDGRILAAAAAESLQVVENALDRIRGVGRRTALTVGFLRSLGPTVAGELMASFLTSRPGTMISHREGSSSELFDDLGLGAIDIAIAAPRPPEGFGWLPMGRQALVLVVPKAHRLAEESTVELEDVRDDSFLALDHRFDSRSRADELCARAGIRPRIVLEADDLVTIRGYVATGMGIAILPADGSLSSRTVSIPLSTPGASRGFGLCWDPSRMTPDIEALIAHTRTLNEHYPGWADILS
jgi:LysR family transcriptional activator of glutamate synthase operon